MRTCRSCGRLNPSRPRGLCNKCYNSLEVRERFPSLPSRGSCRGEPDFYGASHVPEPTVALPGSEEKVLVMIRRCELRQSLFHPRDAKMDLGLLRGLLLMESV